MYHVVVRYLIGIRNPLKNQRDYIKVRFKPTNKGIVLKSLFVKTNTSEKVTVIVLKGRNKLK